MLSLTKKRQTGYLIKRFREAGLINAKTRQGARQTIYLWMRNGKIKLEQGKNGYNYATERQIREMIKNLRGHVKTKKQNKDS